MSYVSLKYHLVFSTKERRRLITTDIRPRLTQYIGGIIRDLGGKMLAGNGPEDHFHVAAILTQKLALMEVLKIVKCRSSQWIHETFDGAGDFDWQDGYGAFTVSHSAMPDVVRYVENQLEHHRKMTFQEELIALLKRHEIEYDERYIWR
jgi:REP element-mobilizing transposase RayT